VGIAARHHHHHHYDFYSTLILSSIARTISLTLLEIGSGNKKNPEQNDGVQSS